MIHISDIAPQFAYLIDKGLSPTKGDYSAKDFGNAFLVMAGPVFSIRFERDRGDVFVDIGSDTEGWYKLEYVIEFVDPSASDCLGQPPQLALMANLLERSWDKISDLFSHKQDMSRLEVFVRNKSESLLATLFHNPLK